MNLIKKIYQTWPDNVYYNSDTGTVMISLVFQGKFYLGESHLHPNDVGFFSSKVGRTIAVSRARIKILENEMHKAKIEYENKCRFYKEVTATKDIAEVDPTGSFYRNMSRALSKYEKLKRAMKREKANLRNYIDGQAKAIDSIKRFREKGNNS